MADVYYEDVFVKFVSCVINSSEDIDETDLKAMISFSNMIISQESLTSRQAAYALRMMKKYECLSSLNDYDLSSFLDRAEWKNAFRILDTTKKVWIDKSRDPYMLCLKYPYECKSIFDSAMSQIVDTAERFIWDKEEKISKISIHRTRLLVLHDILMRNNFIMDDSYLELVSLLETAMENEDNIIPHCIIEKNSVILKNASDTAEDFWKKNKKNEISIDLLIAKQMGFILKNDHGTDIVKKIATSKANKFWTPDLNKLLELFSRISGKKVILVGGHREFFDDLKKLIESIRQSSIPINKVKICFRESGEQGKVFNDWIRENHLGGKINDEEILIFKDKIPKWLLSQNIDIQLIGINAIYPVTNRYTKIWYDSHHCVIFIGEFKASAPKDEHIVSL